MGKEYYRPAFLSYDNKISRGVSLIDDFEGTFLWTRTQSAGDASGEASATAAYHGTNGFLLKTRATDPADGDWVTASRLVCVPQSGVFVARCRFSFPDVSDVEKFMIGFTMASQGTAKTGGVIISPNTPAFSFINSTGSSSVAEAITYGPKDGSWHTLEVVLNFSTEKYVAASFDQTEADLSGEAFCAGIPSTTTYYQLEFYLETTGANQAIVYIDDVAFIEQQLM